jgi:UDP-N-acetylglucosamine--N-acetylmuramyl-(pentapeptide) pyrophosphoryl-undecaprenol N-acetylglucosamine transferase
MRIVIAGGGTGGHLYPGIAVAREVLARQPNAVVSFAGTASGIEARVIPREGLPLDVIRSGGLKGKGLGDRLKGLALLPLGLADAWRVISRRQPGLVIGVGGYSSGPLVLVAALRRIPTMVLEQNAMPGLTNRWLGAVVDAAAVTYEASLPFFRGKGFMAGNPVRAEFLGAGAESQRTASDRTRVLVFGGSQGAHPSTWPWSTRRLDWRRLVIAMSGFIRQVSGIWKPYATRFDGPGWSLAWSRSFTKWIER